MRSGDYAWASTFLNYRGERGHYWSLRSSNTTYSDYLSFYSSHLSPRSNDRRGVGFAVYSRDYGLLSAPLSYVRSGDYRYYSTELFVRGSGGHYWSLRPNNTTNSSCLSFRSSYLDPQYGNTRGNGFAVRCVSSFLLPRLRPSQRPIIVCEEWRLCLELYGARLQRFARPLLVTSFLQYYALQLPVLRLIKLEPSAQQQSRKRVCGAPPATTASLAPHYHM